MWGKVGVVRSRRFVDQCLRAIGPLDAAVDEAIFLAGGRLEVKNMVQVARCITEAALWRENSVGAHYRSDFPEAKRPGWRQHSQLLFADGQTERDASEGASARACDPQRPVRGKPGKKKADRS